jgi:hypothetical protein
MDGLVKNNFASVLVFYDQFKRTKLAPSDLVKIAKKYGSKSDQLVHDLEKKYGFPIPKECKASNIAHICQTYSVPDAYLAFLPAEFTNIRTLPYDPIYDIRSPLFDAENVISKKRIISANYTFEMFDNLSKCRQLCNTFDGKVFKIENTVKKTTEGKVKAGAYIHVLERVAVDSSAKCNYIDDNGTESLQMSPFALAYTFMKARSRVRVIIRKRARYAESNISCVLFLRKPFYFTHLLITPIITFLVKPDNIMLIFSSTWQRTRSCCRVSPRI